MTRPDPSARLKALAPRFSTSIPAPTGSRLASQEREGHAPRQRPATGPAPASDAGMTPLDFVFPQPEEGTSASEPRTAGPVAADAVTPATGDRTQEPPGSRLRSSPVPPARSPAALLRGMLGRERLDPGAPGARVLVLLGVLAALVAAGYLWMARPRPEPAAGPAPTPTMAGPGPSAQGEVVVHVHGKVRRPGVVTLPKGARIADAIKAAGGTRPGAETGSLNLARKLADGEQVSVGVPARPPRADPSGSPAAGGGVNLNTATAGQLEQLPGVGPVLARRILDHRTRHGGFRSVDQLQEVSGIGAKRFADLKDKVRV